MFIMKDIENTELANLIEEILADPGDEIPEDLRQPLIDHLAEAFLISPVADGQIGLLQIGPRVFIPASCDMEDFRRIFEDATPEAFEFRELMKRFRGGVDGIMVNPGSFGFIINKALGDMVFKKTMAPVERGYDVKVRMKDMRPIHWRDLIIPENITFYELDDILKTLWGFNGHHLSMFIIRSDNIHIMDDTVADACMEMNYFDSRTTIINDFFDKYKKITYWYDFGDDWTFDIEIKKAVDYDLDYVTIKRFKGKYDPIEDCKGIYGLSEVIYYAEHPDEADDSYFSDLTDYLNEFDMEYAQDRLKNRDYVRRMYE